MERDGAEDVDGSADLVGSGVEVAWGFNGIMGGSRQDVSSNILMMNRTNVCANILVFIGCASLRQGCREQ